MPRQELYHVKSEVAFNSLISDRLLEHAATLEKRAMSASGTGGGAMTSPRPASVRLQDSAFIDASSHARITHRLDEIEAKASRMRLDRQLTSGWRYLFNRTIHGDPRGRTDAKATKARPKAPAQAAPQSVQAKTASAVSAPDKTAQSKPPAYSGPMITADMVIICPIYPGGPRPYGGEFVQKRAEYYRTKGMDVVVLEVNPRRTDADMNLVNGVPVHRVNSAILDGILSHGQIARIGVHHIERPVWDVIKPYAGKTPIIIWVHGFEARDWRELEFNYTEEELVKLRPILNDVNVTRSATLKEVFTASGVDVIFVSAFMRSIAEKFAGVTARSGHVIHNPILPEHFPYKPRDPEQRKKILWVRSFGARNYSNDISRDVILGLSEFDFFPELEVSIYGDGKFFEESTDPLRDFPNVKIERRMLSLSEMQAEHDRHGVMLVPTRWDSQGLTAGEAMASGLVPLASHVAGMKEFAAPDVAILAGLHDSQALIDGYRMLYEQPDLYLEMSRKAARHSAAQSGPAGTLARELDVMRFKSKGMPG